MRVFACLFAGLLVLGADSVFAQESEGTVRGRVVEEDTGEPVGRANVLLFRRNGRRGTSTDENGRYQISLPPGEYILEVSALRYHGSRRMVALEAGETVRLDLELSPRDYSLNEIVVSEEQRAVETVSTVQHVDYATLESQDAADVSELAELVPATHVQTNSRGQTIWYFRNAGDRQVGQFFDGALLNIPWDNRVNISLIPASVVEEITVTKGVPSVRYGANVMGGAVNFQSRTLGAPGQRTELTGTVGTAEQRRVSVTHLGRTDRWDYTGALQYTTRGNQPLPQGANLEYNQPLSDRRVNTDRRLLSGFGRASYRFRGKGQLGVSLLHVDAEQGVAPEGNKPPSGTRYWRYPLWQKSTAILSGQVPLGPSASIRGAAWGSRFARDIADYEGIDYRTLTQIQQGRDFTGGLRLIGTQRLPSGSLTLALNGLTSQHEKTIVPSDQSATASVSTFQQHIFSGGVEYEAPVNSRVQVTAGGSFDGTATPETGPFFSRDPIYTWGMNTGIRIDLGQEWTLRGAFGRKSRFPTMRELFGTALGKFVPNSDLRPVSAWIGEGGVGRRGTSWTFEVVSFFNRVSNKIGKTNLETESGRKVKRINLRGARVYGVESILSWQATDVLRLNGNVMWSRPRSFTEEEMQKLDEKPGWLATGVLNYEPPFGLSLMGKARYTGNTYVRLDRVTGRAFGKLPSALVLDARLAYRLPAPGGLEGELYAHGENLTDEVQFIGLGLPRPGRSLRVGLEVHL